MRRIDLRTRDAWRSYDIANGVIALLLPAALGVAWLTGFAPPAPTCCGASTLAAKAPAVTPLAPASPVASLIAPEIELASANGRLTLRGTVADEATRMSLVDYAKASFGAANVIDNIKVDGGRSQISWLNSAKQILSDFRDMPAPATISAAARIVTLTGTVESEGEKDLRGARARQLFGDGVTIANGITVRKAAPAPVTAPKIDCVSITRGAEVEFATGSAELTSEGRATLDAVAPCLESGLWEVGGHTDNRGSDEINQALSWARATSAIDYLKTKGRPVTLKPVGYGRIDPIADNNTEEGRAQNRRLSFKKRG